VLDIICISLFCLNGMNSGLSLRIRCTHTLTHVVRFQFAEMIVSCCASDDHDGSLLESMVFLLFTISVSI
jgi:hypothetical protein